MESDFPQSAHEAEEHIYQIRRDKGLGDGPDRIGNNAADLESALGLLSDDLYQTTTHFLLELIQNADDNSYETKCPTLTISYSPGRVRVDCNERGFSKKNVEAICRICQSTKSDRSKSAGFVGEKGIGFKAVFKVAPKVWISSGHYSFRFDREGHLGMIAPIWDKFPGKPKEEWTSFLLEITNASDEASIIHELKSYDEKMLLFLRRLRKLEINCTPNSRRRPFHTVLSSHGAASENPSVAVLSNNGTKKHYFVWRHSANKMPSEPRRPGILSSEIVLAFPNTGIGGDLPVRPIVESQHLFAFLPIRDGGLPFLLQADFLLPASREDVHIDSAWNRTLSVAAAVAYVDAVRSMAEIHPSLRYNWVEYIPVETAKTDFLYELRQDILGKLERSEVFYSHAGNKKQPSGLIRVRTDWCDESGRPVMISRDNADRFLASQYPKLDNWSYLSVLGLPTMAPHDFFDEMEKATKKDPAAFFRDRTKEWHSSLARAIVAANSPYEAALLPIVPLRDGKWVSSRKEMPVYIRNNKSEFSIPEGIETKIVSAEASDDPDRAALFVHLGIQALEESHIRNIIINTHKDSKFKPNSLGPGVIISHAEFLFRTRSIGNQCAISLWMATDTGHCHKSDTLYIPSDSPGAAYLLLPKRPGQKKYAFIHAAYLEAGGPDKKLWLDYLQTEFRVGVYPRLVRMDYGMYSTKSEGFLHSDFKLLMKNSHDQSWLMALRDGWEYYKEFLEYDELRFLSESEAARIVQHLGDVPVKCTGSKELEMLKHTYMPFDRLKSEYGSYLPFLDLPDSQNPSWIPLMKRLKVGSETDITFFLKCLSGLKEKSKVKTETTTEEFRHIMHQIEDQVELKEGCDRATAQAMIRNVTFQQILIYIPPNDQKKGDVGSWVSPADCFWRGESWITRSAGLAKPYADLETLFRTHLLVPNASIDHFIREAAALSTFVQPSMRYLEKLFLALTNHVRAQGLDFDNKMRLKELDMFPITTGSEINAYEYLSSALAKKPWLVADRANLRTQFRSMMPVLAFSTEFIFKIKCFLRELDIDERFLSQVATSTVEANGDVKLHSDLTQRYRKRCEYLFRLMPEGLSDQKQLRRNFRDVEVYTASEITQCWRAPLGIREIQSKPTEGAAFLESDYAGDLRIFIRAGYEDEAYPYELSDQLQNFFHISAENRDLVTVALCAPMKRVDQLFEARGVIPFVEDEDATEENNEDGPSYIPVGSQPGPSQKRRLAAGKVSRFSRLFSHKRFSPSFSQGADHVPAVPPSYGVAVARAAQTAVGRPAEPRRFGDPVTLNSLQGTLKDMDFVPTHGIVVSAQKPPPTFLGQIKVLLQRDNDAGELMVSDILSAVLGPQYDRSSMWTSRDQRNNRLSAFNFMDTQGRFGSFLMRLDGMSGQAQGYTHFIYHLDVKATDTDTFKITQDELDRARENSVHTQPNPDEAAQSKHISVIVHISDFRTKPKIRFLADPWDLFEDGQLILDNLTTYQARLNLKRRHSLTSAKNEDTGFDIVQMRSSASPLYRASADLRDKS